MLSVKSLPEVVSYLEHVFVIERIMDDLPVFNALLG